MLTLGLAAAAIVVAAAGYRLWIRFPGGAGLLEDDSYFYAQIAHQLGTRGLSSFDGESVTDGYHLLWGWLLAAVVRIVSLASADKHVLLGGMIALYFFVAGTVALRYATSGVGRGAVVFFALLYSGLTEGALLGLLLAAFVHESYLEDRAWRGIVATGLVPLARVDAGVIVLLLGVAMAVEGRRVAAQRVLVALAAGVVAHFGALWLTTGRFVSVAARIKAGGLATLAHGNLDKYTALTAVVLAIALLALQRAPDPRARRARTVILVLAAYLAGQLLFNRNVRYWYYMPALMLAATLIDRFAVARWRPALAGGFAALALGAIGFKVHYTRTHAAEVAYAARFVAELPRLVPAGERIFARDGAGYLGYFSGRTVIAGDGLVASHAYVDRLLAGQLDGYLAEAGIRYLVTNIYRPASAPADWPLLRFAGLEVRPADVTPLRLPPPDLRKMVAFALYRLER